MIGIGIDFGTTNTTVAVVDGLSITYLELDLIAEPSTVMPTALYIRRSMEHTVGRSAIASYLGDNVGRVIRLQKVDLGSISMTVNATDGLSAPGHSEGDAVEVSVRVRGDDDAELPGRLFRGLKSYLGVTVHERVKVFNRQFRTVALITLILTKIREIIEENGWDLDRKIYVGRPINFVGGIASNKLAISRMKESCINAGFKSFVFYPEPIAASLNFLYSSSLDSNSVKQPIEQHSLKKLTGSVENLLTFDFGGGTLDLCLLTKKNNEFSVLGTRGVAIGGNKIDQLIMKDLVFPELGEGLQVKSAQHISEADTVFPFYRYSDYVLNWQMSYMMNQPELMEILFRGIRSGPEQEAKLGRLWRLIRGNYCYALLNATEQAKARLSENEETSICLSEIDLDIDFSRDDLSRILISVVEEIEALVFSLLQKTFLSLENIDRVVCTGGSSQLLPVQKKLESLFPGKIEKFDYYRSIAGGLALANANGFTYELV